MKLILITLILSFSAIAAPEKPERANAIVNAIDKSLRENVLNCVDVMFFEGKEIENPATTDMLNFKESHAYAQMEVELNLESVPATITFRQKKDTWSGETVVTLSDDKKSVVALKVVDKQKGKFSDLGLADILDCPDEPQIVTHTLDCK